MGCKKHQDKSSSGGASLAIAAVIALVMASGAAHGGHGKGGTPALLSDAAAPAVSAPVPGGCCGAAWWAGAFLADAGLPRTACNVSAVVAWENAEGTHSEFLNPLDTTEREPGSRSVNSVGVQHFTSWGQGLHATVVTLYNGHYPGVIAALRAGNDAGRVARAVWVPHVWGTQPFSATC